MTTTKQSPLTGLNKCALLLLAALLLCQGCVTPLTGRAAGERPWGEPTWGKAVEGLQCRLRPDRRAWKITETPSFTFDLRNRGKRTFAFWPDQKLEMIEIEFDGKWHRWPETVMIDSQVWPLPPGAEYNAVTISLDKRFKIAVAPGKHIVRLALPLEGLRVVSNPVGIVIAAPD